MEKLIGRIFRIVAATSLVGAISVSPSPVSAERQPAPTPATAPHPFSGGAAEGVVGNYTNVNYPERQVLGDWSDSLLNQLGSGFTKRNNNTIWFQGSSSGRNVPVLVDINSRSATFQEGNDEGGRESVGYFSKDHLYVLSNTTLVGVSSYEQKVLTFDEVSKTWMERLGEKSVSRYISNTDGTKTVMVWTKGEDGKITEVSSGYAIDASGALVKN